MNRRKRGFLPKRNSHFRSRFRRRLNYQKKVNNYRTKTVKHTFTFSLAADDQTKSCQPLANFLLDNDLKDMFSGEGRFDLARLSHFSCTFVCDGQFMGITDPATTNPNFTTSFQQSYIVRDPGLTYSSPPLATDLKRHPNCHRFRSRNNRVTYRWRNRSRRWTDASSLLLVMQDETKSIDAIWNDVTIDPQQTNLHNDFGLFYLVGENPKPEVLEGQTTFALTFYATFQMCRNLGYSKPTTVTREINLY